jgi:hypothetical protein
MYTTKIFKDMQNIVELYIKDKLIGHVYKNVGFAPLPNEDGNIMLTNEDMWFAMKVLTSFDTYYKK